MNRKAAYAATLFLALAGCATWREPADVSDAALRGRAITAAERGAHVAAAVLSAEDSLRMFGDRLENANVQAVWIEVQNNTSQPLWLLRAGTDPDYFSPLEVAWSMHTPLARDTNERINHHYEKLAFKNPIAPGATSAGIVFSNPQRRTKLLNIDLFGRKTLIPFSLFLPVPQEVAGAEPSSGPPSFRYPDSELTDYKELAELRAAIEQLPCCASDASGVTRGDPLNVVLVGEIQDIAAAVVRRHYRRDARPFDTVQHVFGRAPDVVVRKYAQGGAPATWIRAWLAPIRFQGRSVYLTQVGRPVGGRFAPRDAATLELHEDVDEARNLLVQDMIYSGGLEMLGFATGVDASTAFHPAGATDRARHHTDGLRAVLFFATRPRNLSDVELLDWVPYATQRDAAPRGEGNERGQTGR